MTALVKWPLRHPLGFSLLSVGLGLLILLGSATVSLASAWKHLNALQAVVQSPGAETTALSRLPELHHELAASKADLVHAQAALAIFDPLLRAVGRLPGLRPLAEAPDLLDLGIALAGAGADVTDGLGSLSESDAGRWHTVVTAIDSHRAEFARGSLELDQAATSLSRLDRASFTGRLAPIGTRLDQLDHWLPLVQEGVDGVGVLPVLLGARRPMSYLLVGQNEEEKRATGGFMGSLGIARVESGDVTQLDIRNSYDYTPTDRSPLPPPIPLAEWMGFGGWYIRDANWFPDFPTSAAWIEWFWNYYYATPTDGVIAFDQEAFQQLLTIAGPVDLPDLGERITADNYRSRMLYWLYQSADPTGDRQYVRGAKTPFIRELGAATFKKLLALSPEELVRSGPTAVKLLDEKHVLLSFRDAAAARIVAERGWDGHIDTTSPDYLFVDDTTVSYTKLAPFVRESIDESVQLGADGSTHDVVDVHYKNDYQPELARNTYPHEYLGEFWNRTTGKLDYQEGYYATYVRIYVPAAAKIRSFSGGEEASTEEVDHGRKVVATYLQLPAGASRTAHLELDLPPGTWTISSPYRLLIQKQPGTDKTPIGVRVAAPPGESVVGATSGQRTWTDDLVRDARFSAVVLPGTTP